VRAVNVEQKVNPQFINNHNRVENPVNLDVNKLEFCEVCGKSFHTLGELINHAEKIHIMGTELTILIYNNYLIFHSLNSEKGDFFCLCILH